MPADFCSVFAILKPVLAKHEKSLVVRFDTPAAYSLLTQAPSPFPQHKGEPMFFAALRLGKNYVGFHLMPVYMCPELIAFITPALKKRMQGKSCFNFKTAPESELLADLRRLTDASVAAWREKNWL